MTSTNDAVFHRIMIRRGDVTAVRERIERVLGVTTTVHPIPAEHGGGWDIDFAAPADVDLDFLRPDVLPPKDKP